MSPPDPAPQDERPTLAMENELLRHETTHLRARLAAADAEVARLRAPGKNAGPAAPAADDPEPAAAPRAEPARQDLVRLLDRLEANPLSRLLRRNEDYRRLLSTYLSRQDT